MARFLRSYGKSIKLKPAVVGPIAILPPVRAHLADQRATTLNNQRKTHVKNIRAPAVVGPIAILPPVRAKMADQRSLWLDSRKTKPILKPPAVVGAIAILPPVRAKMADQRSTWPDDRRARYIIGPPAVVNLAITLPPPKAKLADQVRPNQAARKPHPKLNPPAVVNPIVPTPPAKIFTTRIRPSKTHSILRLPVTSGIVTIAPSGANMAFSSSVTMIVEDIVTPVSNMVFTELATVTGGQTTLPGDFPSVVYHIMGDQ